ncbi:MAG: hypothetical protein CME70_15920 [Halobacteriovorax sp.]|nr:hypothetical protein [Halobacteriovorax sp.]|tara:strand:+ start:52064 stop:52336 length:273 start_codon:yes stop_codon:yes gene_type:complete
MRHLFLVILLFSLSGCKFPKVVSAFYAKEVCSCLFVEKQKEEYCHEYGKQIIPIWTKEIDYKNKSVKAFGLWKSTEASFISLRSGCQIVK